MMLIESIDDEKFLTSLVSEKDYSKRDSLTIAVQNELLDFIMEPKIESIIKRIWSSDFETSGSLLEISSVYQVLTSEMTIEDVEERNRFYKSRNLDGKPQYDTIYEIFKVSMLAKLKGITLVLVAYVIAQIYYLDDAFIQLSKLTRMLAKVPLD